MDERIAHLRRIFRHLKVGVFPPEAIEAFTVGRGSELKKLDSRLDIVATGPTGHVFLEGDYGSGKSHTLKALESLALRRNFAVSWITLDGHAHSCNHPARYFHSLLESLRVDGLPLRGLASLTRHWLRSERAGALLAWAERSDTWLQDPIIYCAHNPNNIDNAPHFNSIIESRDIAHKNGKSGFQLVSDRMDATASALKAIGYAGVVYLFDELETVATLLWSIRQRYLSYEFLNTLVDGRRHSHCFYAFAATPDFGEKVKTDRLFRQEYTVEYPDGCRFIQKWVEGAPDIIPMKPISRKDVMNLCHLLVRYHQEAYGWKAEHGLIENLFASLVLYLDRKQMSLREVVSSFVYALDVCEQHPSERIAFQHLPTKRAANE